MEWGYWSRYTDQMLGVRREWNGDTGLDILIRCQVCGTHDHNNTNKHIYGETSSMFN